MAPQKQYPPLDGSIRVLPGLLDFHAEHNPTFHAFGFPSRDDPNAITYISYTEYAQASHRAAHIIRPGRKGADGEIIALVVNIDALVYMALLNGMARAGTIPFPMSPRNSPESIFSMLEKTDCHRIISQPSLSHVMSHLKDICASKNFALKVDNVPSLPELFPTLGTPSAVTPYPPPTKPGRQEDILLILHSSGSTGFPKPIPETQQVLTQWIGSENMKFLRIGNVRYFTGLVPSFHTMGIYMQLLAAFSSSEPVILFTPKDPEPPIIPNAHNILEVAKMTGCRALGSVPSFLEVWANSEEALKFLASCRDIRFSGGPLSEKSARKLVDAGVDVVSIYGSTESGAGCWSADSRKYGYAWLTMGPELNPRWVPQGDGTYELQLLTCNTHQPAVENLLDVKGYATSDLFIPHPTVKGLWKIVGRTDDVIVLSTGEKIVPIPQESLLASSPLVAGVVMFGRERPQPGVLIEPVAGHEVPAGDTVKLVEFRDKIWHWVEEGNKTAPAFARIFKEMIIVADPKKPFPRAGKGTVPRKQALAVYAKEINDLYDTVAQSADSSGIQAPSAWTVPAIETWLSEHAKSIMTDETDHLTPTVDLFEHGFDSLSATYLRNRIIGALRNSTDSAAKAAATEVPQDLIFVNPTIHKLAIAVVRLVDPAAAADALEVEDGAFIEKLVHKYSLNLPKFKSAGKGKVSDIVVLLTGTTGALGSHVLAGLLADKRVKRIFAFNRPSARHDRQKSAFKDNGFPLHLLESKSFVPLVGDLSRPDMGLDQHTFNEVKDSVTHIIHNAWKLDFNITVSSFEGLIGGVRNLLDITAQCKNPVKFMFTSSISAVHGWDASRGPVPEQVILNADVAAGMGYGASKYTVERLLANASKSGLSTTTFRIGQITGSPPAGAWNTTDWVPIVVKSSQVLGCLPSLDTPVAWITMSTAAHTIIDVVLSATDYPDPVLVNLVHPRPVSWDSVFQGISGALPTPLPLIPFAQWLAKVEQASQDFSTNNFEKIPAIKLLKFLNAIGSSGSGQQDFETTQAQRVSPTLAHASQIDAQAARSWVDYWSRKGFLHTLSH